MIDLREQRTMKPISTTARQASFFILVPKALGSSKTLESLIIRGRHPATGKSAARSGSWRMGFIRRATWLLID
jgi:hypothetical protein